MPTALYALTGRRRSIPSAPRAWAPNEHLDEPLRQRSPGKLTSIPASSAYVTAVGGTEIASEFSSGGSSISQYWTPGQRPRLAQLRQVLHPRGRLERRRPRRNLRRLLHRYESLPELERRRRQRTCRPTKLPIHLFQSHRRGQSQQQSPPGPRHLLLRLAGTARLSLLHQRPERMGAGPGGQL